MTLRQKIFRPSPAGTLTALHYPASTFAAPPGPGVHGKNGYHAARHALRHEFGNRTNPFDLLPAIY
ncbi:hypothetical protein [Nocardia sp. NPDC050710]|uniref:hypothetical protein n=1 Tax=Nocardia sp. NPDC050710 TaxID=3157220 RepID=UPI003402532F